MKVEKGRPVPGKYPFDEMEVGDSFLIPEDVKRHTVAVAALRYWRKTGKKFTTRRTPEGYCCWRVK